MKELKGKTVLITGAAGGIGSLLARKLYTEEESNLILVDKNRDRLEKLKKEIENKREIYLYSFDLSSKDEIENFISNINERHKIDILISNAGIVHGNSFKDMSIEEFEKVINVNFLAAVRLIHGFLDQLTENNGHIVLVASGTGLLAPGGLSAYSSSKYALVGFSESLRAEIGDKVKITTICPAFVKTDIIKNSITDGDREKIEKLDKLVKKTGTNTEKVCRIIIRSIKKEKGLVTVGIITKFLWLLKRVSPTLTDYLNKKMFKFLTKNNYV